MTEKKSSPSFWARNLRKIVVLLIMVLLFGFFFWKSKQPTKEPEKKEVIENVSENIKTVQGVTFGSWQGGGNREVLATVESLGDVTLNAELSGTINQVYVNIGDRVTRGQVLARYERGNDATFINYQNAVSSLEQAKITTQNSVTQSEIALNNAEAEFKRQQDLQNQINKQSFTGLETQSLTAQTNIYNALNWADRIVQGSQDFRNDDNGVASKIGSNDIGLKQDVRNSIRDIKFDLQGLNNNFSTKPIALNQARIRLDLLDRTRVILQNMDLLIRQTPATASFSVADRASFQQQVEGYKTSIDGQLSGLRAQIEAVASQDSQSDLSLEQARNRITTAKANLELAKANAAASVNASENSLGLASSSLSDLQVMSPFNGTVSEKFITDFQQVNPGTPLFSIVDSGTAPKVTAFVTKSELEKLVSASEIQVALDNKTITVSNAAMSTKVDSATQKVKVEYSLPAGSEVLVGSLGRLQIPSIGKSDILLPLTAVSFEPDGAEVMVVVDGKVARKKVLVGEIISGGIEILDGLNVGETIVQYRSRVYVGEPVKTQ